MDFAFLERLIELVGRAPITELELAGEGWRLRLVKAAVSPASEASAESVREATPEPQRASSSIPAGEAPHVVAAGLVGVFYRAAAPGQQPCVAVGDTVHEGQTLGILEAMKTLIAAEADRAGRIEAVLQEDGTSVQGGDPLFLIVPADRA